VASADLTLPAGEDTSGPARRYQRERLNVGIVGIGLMVVGAPMLAATDTGRGAVSAIAVGPAPLAGALAAMALALLATVVLLPVDWVGGVRVERRFGMGGDAGWWRRFAGGAAAWIAAFGAAGAAVGAATLAGAAWWAVAGALAGGAVIAAATAADARSARIADPATAAEHESIAASLRPLGAEPPPIGFVGAEDERALDGGWAGSTLLLTRSCRPLVGDEMLACLVVRELAHRRRRDRARGILVGALWTAAAAPLTALLWTPDPAETGTVILTLAATATVWSWIGLLALPTLGRRQVAAADRAWLEAGGAPATLRRTIRFLADRNLGNHTLPPWVERIFHPVPSVATRLAAIDAWESR